MSMAKVEITCGTCGKTFLHRNKCYNRRAADDYEAWAVKNICECPDCYRDRKRKEKAAAQKAVMDRVNRQLQELGVTLPEICGSEKQIAYANDLRLAMLGRDESCAVCVAALQRHDAGDYDGMRALISPDDGRPDEVSDEDLDKAAEKIRTDNIYYLGLIALCGDAKKLIETLRHTI